MTDPRLEPLREEYRATLAAHGDAPTAVKMSRAGQHDRFAQLATIGDLEGATLADVGCGHGDFYAYLAPRVDDLRYVGVDLLPELASRAAARFPAGRFVAADVLADGLPGEYDYVLLSAVFNDPMDDPEGYLRDVVAACWPAARLGLGFNFISDRAAQQEPEALAYHDPAAVLAAMLELTPRVELSHYYARADVSVFLRPSPR